MFSVRKEAKYESKSRLLRLPAEIRFQILENILSEPIIVQRAAESFKEYDPYVEYYLAWNTGIITVSKQIYRESYSIYRKQFHKIRRRDFHLSRMPVFTSSWSAASILGISEHTCMVCYEYHAAEHSFASAVRAEFYRSIKKYGAARLDLASYSQSEETSRTPNAMSRYVFGTLKLYRRRDVINLWGSRYIIKRNKTKYPLDLYDQRWLSR